VNFLVDEGVDRQIVDRLRLDGHQVAYVAEMSAGIVDEAVLAESRNSASGLITADKDFGDLIFRNHQATAGVMLIRLFGLKLRCKGDSRLHCDSRTRRRIARRICGSNRWKHSHPPQISRLETFPPRAGGDATR
jgi:predicted nuclease of predicted toxin-antitoxin system